MPTDRVVLTFGALAKPIHVQLGVPMRAVASCQRDADALTRLAVRGVLSSSEVESARRRLVRRIAREIAHAD